MPDPQTMSAKRPKRRKLFGGLAVVAGVVLIAFEFGRPEVSGSATERWFWSIVAAGLIVLGAAELASPREEQD